MDNTICLIQAPSSPDDANGSLVQRKFAGHSLLEWVVRRVMDVQRADQVVVVLSSRDAIYAETQQLPADIPVMVVTEDDRLKQMCRVLQEYPARGVVRVSVANPFIDPILIDRLIVTAETHPACDYVGYCFGDGRPVLHSRVGVFADWCLAHSIFQIDRQVVDTRLRGNVTHYFCSRPEAFCLRLIPVPPELDRDDLRLTVDGDWEKMQDIYEALGPDGLEPKRIGALLGECPLTA